MVKVRMNTADVAAKVKCLRRLIGMRCSNVYDITSKNYMFKLMNSSGVTESGESEKVLLLMESGVRMHITAYIRSDREFLYQILGEVNKAGATTLDIPETVGYTVPKEFGELIADIKANTPGIKNVIISTHCQNDLDLSTANTVAGACSGARQLEVTINGIGERAGNSLEEVVMTLKCRGQSLGGLHTVIRTEHIIKTSKMVAAYSGLLVQPHKAIVGANAFKYESGIHQHGRLKHKDTYEIMSPENIGLHRADESGLVLGKLSGRHALNNRLEQLGYFFEGQELDDIFWRFKSVVEKKKHDLDEDIEALVIDEIFQLGSVWSLCDTQVTCGTLGLSTATVKLLDADGKQHA